MGVMAVNGPGAGNGPEVPVVGSEAVNGARGRQLGQ
jgi:hypothetical protein